MHFSSNQVEPDANPEQEGSTTLILVKGFPWLLTIDLQNLVCNDVEMLPIAPNNLLPKRSKATKEAKEMNALKLSEECHNSILDEIQRRECLEFDPSRVLDADEDEYFDNDDQQESEDEE